MLENKYLEVEVIVVILLQYLLVTVQQFFCVYEELVLNRQWASNMSVFWFNLHFLHVMDHDKVIISAIIISTTFIAIII